MVYAVVRGESPVMCIGVQVDPKVKRRVSEIRGVYVSLS